jgi:DNA-binding transcriptional LysR family regulator
MTVRFLIRAKALSEANELAQRLVVEIRSGLSETLRIGAVDFLTAYPERALLVDRFVESNPRVRLEIFNGSGDEIFQRLSQGELDVALAFTTSAVPGMDIETTVLSRRVASLLVPAEDPLAGQDEIQLEQMRGRIIVTSPGRSDPRAFKATYAAFAAVGATFLAAPEANRTTIEHYARIKRLPCLKWSAEPIHPTHLGDMTCIRIKDDPLWLTFAILRVRGLASRPVARFCELGSQLAQEHAAMLKPAML